MPMDLTDTRTLINDLLDRGAKYFDDIYCHEDTDLMSGDPDPDLYWSALNENQRGIAVDLQSDLLKAIKAIANCLKHSSLSTEADSRDLSTWTKSVRASIRLRRYYAWDSELLHDEGVVLGVQQAGQSEIHPFHPDRARTIYQRDLNNLKGLIDIIAVSPVLLTNEFYSNPQVTAEYELDTAFIMMQIDPDKPELEDLFGVIKDCFKQFRIEAVRADEIEHEDKITDKIVEKIRISEFLFAEMTGELPNVYYEVGYAHALGRKVIMYRKKGTRIHFDLKDYNCPSYKNFTELGEKLTRRLKHMTNRRPKALKLD